MTTVKTCFKCKVSKPRTEFYRHPLMGDGHLGKCKACTRKDVRNNYASRAEYYKAYDAKRNAHPSRKARAVQSFRVAAQRHPERLAAARMVANAIKRGELKRQPCWVCGEKAQGHHPDYSRPLDVVWLCLKHHRQAHALVRTMDDDAIAA